MKNIRKLYLQYSQFSGMHLFIYLTLFYKFSIPVGTIPNTLNQLTDMLEIFLNGNQLNGKIFFKVCLYNLIQNADRLVFCQIYYKLQSLLRSRMKSG